MLTFKSFTGINNVLPPHRLGSGDLLAATNVDVGLTGEVVRRAGLTKASDLCHKNLHQAAGFMLATCGPELTAIHPGGARHVIHPVLGSDRVWYCNLPDGRTTYTNGLIQGVTDGFVGLERSVAAPDSLGVVDPIPGLLIPGEYRYYITHRRGDGVESPAAGSVPIGVSSGGVRLSGLPVRLGFETLVYLSSADGEGAYLAGATSGADFEYAGSNVALVLPCRTVGALPFPVGTITAFWRGRVLVAQGNVLWASRASAPHLADWRNFKQFSGEITAIQPVKDGVYVGTSKDLVWLGGDSWDDLTYTATQLGAVTPGSGVTAPGSRIKAGKEPGDGTAMLCIANGEVVAGFSGGQTVRLTGNRFHTDVTEVCATFREVGGIPQYVAVPQ